MEKEFCTYNQALRLKALGFDFLKKEPCLAYYNESNSNHDLETRDWWHLPKNDFQYALSAPTFSQAFRWFREKHHLEGEISKRFRRSANAPNPDETFYSLGIYDFTLGRKNYIVWLSGYDADKGEKACTSYEEAESACLDKLIQIIEGKEK